jgi:hypothetical protein
MSECLHWTETAKTTAAVLQVLKPGGTFAEWYCSDPNIESDAATHVLEEIREHWCQLRTGFSEVSARTLWVENTGYDCTALAESVGCAPGTQRIKVNTNGSDELWLRSKTRPWAKYPKEVEENNMLGYPLKKRRNGSTSAIWTGSTDA